MSQNIQEILAANAEWAANMQTNNAALLDQLSKGQHPPFIWIGCADSRVPPSVVTQSDPGSLFVHRNVANMVVATDNNLLSSMFYAVRVLKVKHVVICGHYGCGGVAAAMGNSSIPVIDGWLQHIKAVYDAHAAELDAISDHTERVNRFVELNVMAQVNNVAKLAFVQEAWAEGEAPHIHGLVYDLGSGKLKDLGVSCNSAGHLPSVYQYAFGPA